MNITIAAGLKDALKPEINQLNQHLENLAKETDGFLGDLRTYILTGSGKRIRPALVMLCARLGQAKNEDIQTVSAAVELIHIATLVHDDVIDKAVIRRNRKTVAAEHGVDAAVLLGDHIYTYAYERVAALSNPLILQLLARSTSIMCAGEIEQLKRRFQFDLSEADYFSFIGKKTASLFGASARCGAILANQSVEIQTAVEKFAYDLGLAFQITDDLLDLTGEESVVGKTLRTDLLNGKMTLPLIFYRDSLANAKEAQAFKSDLLHPNGQISELIEKIKSSGAMDYSENVADRHISQALEQLNKLPEGPARQYLSMLVDMIQRRKA